MYEPDNVPELHNLDSEGHDTPCETWYAVTDAPVFIVPPHGKLHEVIVHDWNVYTPESTPLLHVLDCDGHVEPDDAWYAVTDAPCAKVPPHGKLQDAGGCTVHD